MQLGARAEDRVGSGSAREAARTTPGRTPLALPAGFPRPWVQTDETKPRPGAREAAEEAAAPLLGPRAWRAGKPVLPGARAWL